jgi:hypothetical protein
MSALNFLIDFFSSYIDSKNNTEENLSILKDLFLNMTSNITNSTEAAIDFEINALNSNIDNGMPVTNKQTSRTSTNIHSIHHYRPEEEIACYSCNKQLLNPNLTFLNNYNMFVDKCDHPHGFEICRSDFDCYVSSKAFLS